MSHKNRDNKGRWRNKTVAFRVSPEEDALIESAVRITGLTKQDYITRRLTEMDVIVQGNPKVYRGLKIEMQKILEELQRIGTGENVDGDILTRIDLIASVMGGMKENKDWR
ncbi:MAG: hypothetical protein LKG26_01810 [Saccharofermentans sp.]|jgi:hypothetical protein|nr:hypothetical protein [Mageeibacillus sp.]MCI1264125.1 hypothetical protein [Saccharofermentans sp.]MCI1274812.1 hypothetical protein [Saccharofermentans sp.]MCI1768636.1 hypothetical protein [Mageeibacillus sp.]